MSKGYKNDLTGLRFNRWRVLKFVPNDKKAAYWECICDCGNKHIVKGSALVNGYSKSCGCLQRETATIHGLNGTRLNNIWSGMRNRCLYCTNSHYKDYGGRGIKICDEWKNDFKNFYEWAMSNGYKENLTIDRIDVNGDYEPQNCRFINPKAQARNKRNNIKVKYSNRNITLAEAAELSGINYKTLKSRWSKGERGKMLFRKKESLYNNKRGAKVTTEQVKEIRKIYKPRDKQYGAKALAERYGISDREVEAIIRNSVFIIS